MAPAPEQFLHALLAVGQEPAELDCGAALCDEGQVTLRLGLLFKELWITGIT